MIGTLLCSRMRWQTSMPSELGQHHVQQDQVVTALFKLGDGFFAVHRGITFISVLLEAETQALDNQRFVVNKQKSFRHGDALPFFSLQQVYTP